MDGRNPLWGSRTKDEHAQSVQRAASTTHRQMQDARLNRMLSSTGLRTSRDIKDVREMEPLGRVEKTGNPTFLAMVIVIVQNPPTVINKWLPNIICPWVELRGWLDRVVKYSSRGHLSLQSAITALETLSSPESRKPVPILDDRVAH